MQFLKMIVPPIITMIGWFIGGFFLHLSGVDLEKAAVPCLIIAFFYTLADICSAGPFEFGDLCVDFPQ